jgi:hypothetical protein
MVRNDWVQAELLSPSPRWLTQEARQLGFRSSKQNDPYGIELSPIYQVNASHPHPDNYLDSFGFALYSKRLVELLQSYEIKSEIFGATMLDQEGNFLSNLTYFIFHLLEGVLDAMDEEKSGWTGDHEVGISHLVLDYDKFEHRPLFKCNHVYVSLMRDDLKQEIQRQGITGFAFLSPERYRSGSYGFAPEFDE